MGADFCCAYLPIPIRDGKAIDLDYDGAFKAIEETDWMTTEWGKDFYDDNDQCRAVLRDAVEEVRRVSDGGFSREPGFIERPTEVLLVTGGMSWGDSPTEFFNAICDLQSSGIDAILTAGLTHAETNTVLIHVPEINKEG